MEAAASVRLDKWLWAVRLYKSRTLAAEACANGKIHIGEQAAKASRHVHLGEIIVAKTSDITKTVKVIELTEKRVGAKLTSHFLEDLTPAAEYDKQREKHFTPFAFRPKGAGRPTKKERRTLNDFNLSHGQA